MKEDFVAIKKQLPGIIRVSSDFYQQPKKRGNNYFVKSPHSMDKTWSLALYPNNRFCDFANGNQSGDCIGFLAYIKGCNQWEALQTLKNYYGLSDGWERDKQEARRNILLQQAQEREKEKRQQAFRNALNSTIDLLQRWSNMYKTALEKGLYKPYTDAWTRCMDELWRTERKLDILCASDQHSYRFMKRGSKYSSDYPRWLLDALDILAEEGTFRATESEIEEIKAQRDFELTRKAGAERRCCGIAW